VAVLKLSRPRVYCYVKITGTSFLLCFVTLFIKTVSSEFGSKIELKYLYAAMVLY
jgi:hypothetical protein